MSMSIDNDRNSIYEDHNTKNIKIEGEEDLVIQSDISSPLQFLEFECWCEYVEQKIVLINDIACVEHKLNIFKRMGKEAKIESHPILVMFKNLVKFDSELKNYFR